MKKVFGLLLIVFLLPLMFFAGCGEQIYNHTISVSSYNINYGYVNGEGIFKTGTKVNLSATARVGHNFLCWLYNGEVVSTEASYSFSASLTTEGNYLAVFDGDGTNFYKFNGFKLEENKVPSNINGLTSLEIYMGTTQSNLFLVHSKKFNETLARSTDAESKIVYESDEETILTTMAFDVSKINGEGEIEATNGEDYTNPIFVYIKATYEYINASQQLDLLVHTKNYKTNKFTCTEDSFILPITIYSEGLSIADYNAVLSLSFEKIAFVETEDENTED